MNSPDPDAIRKGLERVLSSGVFRKSAVLSSFLKYVVNETLENKIIGIKEYTIAVEALGKPVDFNPQTDAVIRIHAGRLRRSLLEYYNGEGADDAITITMNRGSYVPEFSFRTMEKEIIQNLSKSAAENNTHINRLAILPFKNITGLQEHDFMVDGFCEQLSSDLAQFPEIAVIAYFSTSKFKAEKPDVRQAGRELDVSHLITGSIYRDQNHLRISMQLINAISGAQLWTQTFERSINSTYLYDIFDEIIKQVAPKLTGYYGLINRNSSISTQLNPLAHPDTIDAVFWYYHYQIRYTEEIFQIARNRIEKALQQNPNYALGWAVLAQLYIDGEAVCYVTVENPLQKAHKCIERALQLDNDCQHAYLSLSWMFIFQRDKNNAVKSINKCISINPKSSFFLGGACFLLGLQGEYETSIEYFNQVNILNPYYPWWVNLGPIFMHFYNEDYHSALDFANRINIPDVFWNDVFKIAALGQLGGLDEALPAANKFQNRFPGKAEASCVILRALLFHPTVPDRIAMGLKKAGLKV